MPWEVEARKDVGCLRKAAGRWLPTFDPQISEWGNPALLNSATAPRSGAKLTR